MLYSHVLLSKKGHLGNIWIAAHCHKRLNKSQVIQTNISHSIDKILLDEVPVVTYRVLGHLLVGIVRIYSKKVEYLFHDCHKVLAEFGDFSNGKSPKPMSSAAHSSHCSISIPESFELDAFELGVLDDQDRCGVHVRPDEDIMLSDAWKSDGFRLGFSEKYHGQVEISRSPAYSPNLTPLRDLSSAYFAERDVTGGSTSNESMEKLCLTRISLEERLEPLTFEGIKSKMQNDPEDSNETQTGDEQTPHVGSDIYNRTEIKDNCPFRLEDRLEPMIIDDEDVDEAAFAREQIKHSETNVPVSDMELLDESSYKKQSGDVGQINMPEMPSSNSGEHQSSENHQVSLCVDVTPDSKCPANSSMDVMSVRTPATKEQPRALKKRKCLFDNPFVISNKEYKSWLDNPDDLVCKRRKAPHSPLFAWKYEKLSSLPGSLLEPLIPCSALVDTGILVHRMKVNKTVPDDGVETPEMNGGTPPVSPASKHRSQCEQTPIAPSTPVAISVPCRFHDVPVSEELDIMEPPTSVKSMLQKVACETEDFELGIDLMDEETSSAQGDIPEKYRCHARTRKVAMFLLRHFSVRKGEAVKLSCALEGKTKTESAKVFFEILVLKTGGWIDVRQDNELGDICVLQSPKLNPDTFAA
ncbi:unnamed protein product [Cuscuta epithymum]|uniref:Uncharacterized protein n=2 Tax=Cuscuta epithymum TaxID=186058 RepID=A0AAV0D4V7_9ASTE|nr:unnamed protein product [Cuscuta epithymum]